MRDEKKLSSMTNVWPSMLKETELDELDELLRQDSHHLDMLLDGVHGFLTALAVGPVDVPADIWLPKVFDKTKSRHQQAPRIVELLGRLHATIPVEIYMNVYQPILGELDALSIVGDPNVPQLSAAGWCEGFSRGVDLYATLWESRFAEDPRLMQILSPIVALAVDEGVLAADMPIQKLDDDEYDECLIRMPKVLEEVAHYWHTRAPSRAERETAASKKRPVPRSRHGQWLH